MCSDFSATCRWNCLVLICSSETRLFSRRLRFSHPLPPFGCLSTPNLIAGWKVLGETKLISFPSILLISLLVSVLEKSLKRQLRCVDEMTETLTLPQLILRQASDSSLHLWTPSSWIHYCYCRRPESLLMVPTFQGPITTINIVDTLPLPYQTNCDHSVWFNSQISNSFMLM